MTLEDKLKIVIDGQTVYLLDPVLFKSIKADKEINAIKVNSMDLVSEIIPFIEDNAESSLICYLLGRNWMFCIVYRVDNTWKRVQIENLTCNECGWQGISANPTIPELYLGTPNRWETLEETDFIYSVKCPQCKQELPRVSLWTKTL
ncbi:hypothetical protein [Paenibacillus durus]|uniref:Uncharacterized protein n=1 Tax=Paenibacillus durus ATCC 35681 TaxID=1333534 RepID=A0A0F7F7I9_PAEDU|nr:hypothetical protein [Paenibacillus durus]AKG33932.1 hypothetical protein VK70_04500 [Paenibacillus durus ATCC 35681]